MNSASTEATVQVATNERQTSGRNRDQRQRGLEKRGLSSTSVVLLLLSAIVGYMHLTHPTIPSLCVLAVVMTEFIRRMDRGIPLMQITATIAALQWLLGPILSYYLGLTHGRYFMHVPDFYYFTYAIPATSLYCLGVLAFGGCLNQRILLAGIGRRSFFQIGLALVVISFAAEAAAGFAPSGLAFFFHLISQLRYVGALYFLFSDAKFKLAWAIASCLPLAFASAESGMFHDLILWLAMLSTFWLAQKKRSVGQKIAIVLGGFVFIFTIQTIKQDYRSKLRAGKDASLIREVIGVVSEERFLEDDVISLASARLNQGWIVSAIIANVPYYEPYANGETVKTAIVGAFLPRLFWSDKKGAGGQENFRRFTGQPIQEGTSMGISPLGEAYANFGVEGGILFMGIFGLFFSWIYQLVLRQVLKHPDLAFWIPLMFYQGIKAETELIVVFNQLVKGGLVMCVGYLIIHKFLSSQKPRAIARGRKRSRVSPNLQAPQL